MSDAKQAENVFPSIIYLLLIAVPNFLGQEILDRGESLANACYNISWYRKDFSNDCRRILILIIQMIQQPCELTFARIYILNYNRFITVMKKSSSGYTYSLGYNLSFHLH